VCDAFYQGNDCSERQCPFGSDVEQVHLTTNDTIVLVTISFGIVGETVGHVPLSDLNVDGRLPVRYSDDALALVVHTMNGGRYTTPGVMGVWTEADSIVEGSFRDVLRTVPRMSVRDVQVTATRSSQSSPWDTTYSLLFPFGATDVNPAGPVSCLTFASAGANDALGLGCPIKGCRPKVPQLKAFLTVPIALPPVMSVNASAIFSQPPPINAGDDLIPGVWGVMTTLMIRSYSEAETGKEMRIDSGEVLPRLTYAWEQTAIYGVMAASSLPAVAAWALETPLPPSDVRAMVPLAGPFGVLVDISPDDEVIKAYFSGGGSQYAYAFHWSLPSCTATVLQAPSEDRLTYECGRRGTCDRTTAVCKCALGYAGQACDTEKEPAM
jgi:hypothetical protein